jgi:hypothetical protein
MHYHDVRLFRVTQREGKIYPLTSLRFLSRERLRLPQCAFDDSYPSWFLPFLLR